MNSSWQCHRVLAVTVFVFVVCWLIAYLRISSWNEPLDEGIRPPSMITSITGFYDDLI